MKEIKQYESSKKQNFIFSISDFEVGAYNKRNYKDFIINTRQPITSIYNQNIISQEGLLIFNPSPTEPIDAIFADKHNGDGNNLFEQPFACFNIKKDLADHVRRRIKNRVHIDFSFIYPELKMEAKNIHEKTLYDLAP